MGENRARKALETRGQHPASHRCRALAIVAVLGFLGCSSFAQGVKEHSGLVFEQLMKRLFTEAQTSQQKLEAERVSKLLQNGQISLASTALKDMSSESANWTAARELGGILKEATPEDVVRWQSHPTGLVTTLSIAQFTDQELSVFHTVEEVSTRVRSVTFVPVHVKSFMSGYSYGAAHSGEILSHPPPDRELLAYLSRPKDERIFVIGAKEDSGLVERYVAEEKRHGKGVFFYRMCATGGRELCDKAVVGALMKEAGQIVVVDTPAARMSPYVYVEAAAANQLRSGEALVTLIPVPEFVLAIRSIAPDAAASAMSVTAKAIAVDIAGQQQ